MIDQPARLQAVQPQKQPGRSFVPECLVILVVFAMAAHSWALLTVRETLLKSNELTSQQISVTRSQHHVQELATAYLEGRRASQAAEEAGVPVEEPRPEPRHTFINRLPSSELLPDSPLH